MIIVSRHSAVGLDALFRAGGKTCCNSRMPYRVHASVETTVLSLRLSSTRRSRNGPARGTSRTVLDSAIMILYEYLKLVWEK